MKRIFTISILLVLSFSVFAQNNLGKTNDIGRLALSPFIASNTEVPQFAQPLLSDKLVHLVTKNGLSSDAFDRRFVITANIVEISKNISTTTPAIFSVKSNISIYIGDVYTGMLFSSCSLGEITGAGKSDNLAYISMINKIQASDQRIIDCIEAGKSKIIEYYNSQIDFIISRAYTLANQEDYYEAIYVLMDVPDICKDAYNRAMVAIGEIYQMKIDSDSAVALTKATAIWNATLSYDGAVKAASYLAQVHPKSSSYEDADALGRRIATRVKEIDTREWNYTLQEQKDEYNLSIAAINAAKEIGITQAKRPVYNTNIIRWW